MAEKQQEQKEAPPEVPTFGSLTEAMAWVWGEVHRVAKSGKHPQGWVFATESDIADLVRNRCAAAGIVIRQRLIRHRSVQIGETRQNNPIFRHTVKVGYTVCRGAEEWPEQEWRGEADDSSDKGLAKALTACRKTYLIATFQVSSGDDPDAEASPEIAKAHQRSGPPRGRGQDQPYRPAPTREADPPTQEQLERARQVKAAINARQSEDEARQFARQIRVFCEREVGRELEDLNRAEFGQLVGWMEEYAGKLGINLETGEVPPAEPPAAQEPKGATESPPAPAEGAQRPDPAEVPAEQQQAIEEAAARTAQEVSGADPDNPPLSGYEQAVEMARQQEMPQGDLIAVMLEAGAAKESDLDNPETWRRFLAEFEKRVAG